MAHLIALLISIGLLGGFYALTYYEVRRGTRLFAAERARLDIEIERVAFIVENVDLASFLRDEVKIIATRLGHTIAHFSLLVVRAAERSLSRLVRYLRMQHAHTIMPRENTREFVKTLADFKETLRETAHEIPDIQ